MAKGHVETPRQLTDAMVAALFDKRPIGNKSRVLYPGVGTAPFPQAVKRYCLERNLTPPNGVAVEADPDLAAEARDALEGEPVTVIEGDFLTLDVSNVGEFTHVVGNPPYVSIESLSEDVKQQYQRRFHTASGRFDLYFLFFERALDLLEDGGVLVFVTPEKYEYVESAADLRQYLAQHYPCEINHVDEGVFPNHVAYPTVTVIVKDGTGDRTRVELRSGETRETTLPEDGSSWASSIRPGDDAIDDSPVKLRDVCLRIGCGVATGADEAFIQPEGKVPEKVSHLCHPTVAGEDVEEGGDRSDVVSDDVIVCPYDYQGLLPDAELEGYFEWLEPRREELSGRWCVENAGKEWYEWHETPPMDDILRQKIICQDITDEPTFWVDEGGDIVPQHSTYFIVPGESVQIEELANYLNTPEVGRWLYANCQRATGGFLRVQASTLKQMPVPKEFADTYQTRLFEKTD